jgi:hypothetical protein
LFTKSPFWPFSDHVREQLARSWIRLKKVFFFKRISWEKKLVPRHLTLHMFLEG